MKKISYAVEQRLRLIDFLANQFGSCNRKHMTDYFGISPACATRDFKLYEEIAPGNLIYNVRAKAYDKSSTFKRIYK